MKRKTRRSAAPRRILDGWRKGVLIVLFVPSVERDGARAINQEHWAGAALEMFGRVFGGATS